MAFQQNDRRQQPTPRLKEESMKKVLLLAALTAVFISMNADAEQCTKDFPNHFVTNDGTLGFYHGIGGAWWYPCSLSATINSVTPEACRAALATYLTAKAQKQPITLSYPGTCALLNSDISHTDGFAWFGVYWQ